MLSLARQHLQQHAQLVTKVNRPPAAATQTKKPSRADLLAGFPLAASPSKKSSAPSAASSSSAASKSTPSVASSARSAAFTKQSQRRHARTISASTLRRAKALQRKLPRPTLLEQAERSLTAASSAREVERQNLAMLAHRSERKKKSQDTMRAILLATTKPSRHAKQEEEDAEEDDERDDFSESELAEYL